MVSYDESGAPVPDRSVGVRTVRYITPSTMNASGSGGPPASAAPALVATSREAAARLRRRRRMVQSSNLDLGGPDRLGVKAEASAMLSPGHDGMTTDRKSTRLNSSHGYISY